MLWFLAGLAVGFLGGMAFICILVTAGEADVAQDVLRE